MGWKKYSHLAMRIVSRLRAFEQVTPLSHQTDMTCLHRSFENITLKENDRFYAVDDPRFDSAYKYLFCDGSRAHGCKGCFCRKLNYHDYRNPCDTCGRMFLELFDTLWTVRQGVYTYEIIKGYPFIAPIMLEYEVEEIISEYFHRSSGPKSKQRLTVLSFYKQLASKAVDFVMKRERERSRRSEGWSQLTFDPSEEVCKLGR